MSQARAKLEFRTLVSREDALDIVKVVQESLFEACFIEMGTKGSAAMNYTFNSTMPMSQRGGAGKNAIDPNNVGMLSIPKQTKVFVERLRFEAQNKGDKKFDQ